MKNDFSIKTYIHLLIIVILGFLIYSNTFHADFELDDEIYIVRNPAIKDFIYFADPLKVLELPNYTTDNKYAFLTRIAGYFTFALNHHLHGLDVTGYHVFNILIHIINALLVYFLIRLLFRTPFFSDIQSEENLTPLLTPSIFALCSALIFVSHPVQTQAVTYIYQRVTSLATLFFLLSICAYVKSRLSSAAPLKYSLYAISLISAVTAMLVKEISFTLPVIITLFELFFFQGTYGKRVLLLFPFALTMLVLPAVLLTAQGSFSIWDIDTSMNTLASFPDMPRMDYLFTQFRVIVTYIRLLFLPVNQNLDYNYPVYHSFFTPVVFFSFLFLLFLFTLGAYSLYRSKKKEVEERHYLRLISLGIFWFFITLSVESSIIPIKDVIFEHRIYLPSVGFIMAGMAAVTIAVCKIRNRAASRAIIAGIACAICVLSGAAYARNSVWKTNISVWEDNVRKSPSKARPHNNLGVAYDKKGRTDDAIRELLTAIEVDPAYGQSHNNLAIIYDREGRTDDAIRQYVLAIQINPKDEESHYNLGVAYDKKGLTDDAIRELLTAIQINPDYGQARNNLGIIYARMGRTEESIREFLTVKSIAPDSIKAYNNLGIVYGREGRTEEAIHEFLAAIQIDPDYADAHYNLGITYKKQGRFEEAMKEFQTVLRLKPDHAGAKNNLESIRGIIK